MDVVDRTPRAIVFVAIMVVLRVLNYVGDVKSLSKGCWYPPNILEPDGGGTIVVF